MFPSCDNVCCFLSSGYRSSTQSRISSGGRREPTPWGDKPRCIYTVGGALVVLMAARSLSTGTSIPTILSTILSPDLHTIRLSFPMVSTGDLAQEHVYSKKWECLEKVLLKLSQKTGNALRILIILLGGVKLPPCCEELMPRFRRVGEVRFEVAQINYG